MTTADVVKAARIAAGLSQEGLAEAMTLRGFKWQGMTTSRVESGFRSLKWDEGIALSGIIPFSVSKVDPQTQADAIAYRRILAVIGERETSEIES